MKRRLLVKMLSAAVVLIFIAGMAPQDQPYLPVGSDAPAFEIKTADNKVYSLKDMTETTPVFLVFWKERCPHNARAAPLFNNLKEAYGEKVMLIGVVRASSEGASSWVDEFNVNYPMLADPESSVISSYKLRYSICTVQVGTDGKIAAVFEGYGTEEIQKLNSVMAKTAGVDATEIDMTGSPTRKTWG